MDWRKLQKNFSELLDHYEKTKPSSGEITVYYSDHGISVHLYTYDVPDMDRHTDSPWFKAEQQAFDYAWKTVRKIQLDIDPCSARRGIDF